MWLIIIGVGLLVVQALLVLAWWKLPEWAPRWVAEHSPWPEPALRALRSGSSDVAETVERRLLDWGPAIAPALRRAFDRIEPDLRSRVLQLASALARREGIQPGTTFQSTDPRMLSVAEISATREELVQLALAALQDGSGFLPMNAAYLLMPLQDARAVEPFAAYLNGRPTPLDEDLVPLVRLLGTLRDPRAVPALISVLPIRHKPHPAVEEALAECTTAAAVDAVIVATSHAHAVVRMWAAQQYTRLPQSPAFDARMLALIADPERQVCLAAITAAVSAHLSAAGPALLAVAQHSDDPATRLSAVTALGDLADLQAVDGLCALLADPDRELVARVHLTLERLPLSPTQRRQVAAASSR